jgi:predicted MPP superfamily phosphohydrolase
MPHVLLTHNLDALDGSYPGCFDLVLTGHTHMGEKNFILFDGYTVLKLFHIYDNINRQKDEWGVATQRTSLHITSGLGSHGQRIHTTPEGVSLIKLVGS